MNTILGYLWVSIYIRASNNHWVLTHTGRGFFYQGMLIHATEFLNIHMKDQSVISKIRPGTVINIGGKVICGLFSLILIKNEVIRYKMLKRKNTPKRVHNISIILNKPCRTICLLSYTNDYLSSFAYPENIDFT